MAIDNSLVKAKSGYNSDEPRNQMPKLGEVQAQNDRKVRRVGLSEYKAAAYALAEAFVDDHTSRYFIDTPDRKHWTDDRKWDLHLSIMEYLTYAHILKGYVTTAGSDYGCVALWMPPGTNMDDLLTTLRSGLWRLNYKLSPEGKHRFFSEFFPLLHDTKVSVLGSRDNDSYYLVYIGTRPSARGKGYAKACIEHMTKKADAEGRACYLESSNDINPLIYRKHGFKEIKKIYLQRADEPIELDIMVREPIMPPQVTKKQAKTSVTAKPQDDTAVVNGADVSNTTTTTKVQVSANLPIPQACDKHSSGTKALRTYAVVTTDGVPSALTN